MAERQTLLLELGYPGAAYRGVQAQPGLRTVAADLRERLLRVCEDEPRAMTFAARTDSGVSAAQNFASCWFRGTRLNEGHLQQLQTSGDGELCIRSVRFVPRSVNARSSAGDKHYQYRLQSEVPRIDASHPHAEGQPRNPAGQPLQFTAGQWNICPRLSLTRMQAAATLLVGTNDYSAFRALHCDGKSPVKTIDSLTVTQTHSHFTFDVHGASFLRHMVRILVGTLVEVGAGLRSVESVQTVLESKSRELAGMTAPARGLWLMAVNMDRALTPQ